MVIITILYHILTYKGFDWVNCFKTDSPLKKYAIDNIKKLNLRIANKKNEETKTVEVTHTDTKKKSIKGFDSKASFCTVNLDNMYNQVNQAIKKEIINKKDITEFNPFNEGTMDYDN